MHGFAVLAIAGPRLPLIAAPLKTAGTADKDQRYRDDFSTAPFLHKIFKADPRN
jgi:hypothetical protein